MGDNRQLSKNMIFNIFSTVRCIAVFFSEIIYETFNFILVYRKGNISFYGPAFKMDFETKITLMRSLYRFLLSFNSKSFKDIDSLSVPVEYVNCDGEEEFEQFFEAAGFSKKF